MDNVENIIETKSFSDLISDGFRLFIQNYKKLFFVFLPFSILYIIFNLSQLYSYIIWREIVNESYYIFISFIILNYLLTLLCYIIYILPLCLVSIFLFKKYSNVDAVFKTELKKAFNKRMLKPIILYLIYSVLSLPFLMVISYINIMGLGTLYQIYPIIFGIFNLLLLIVLALFIFIVFTYNIEDIDNPMKEAYSLTKGSFLKVYGILIINYALCAIPLNILYLIMILLYGDLNSQIILFYILISSIYGIILAPLLICLLTPLFAFLRKKEIKT
ncbi:MAG: hypothetical protein ACFFAN_12305 [Promethearchaeota archaeon]